MPFHVVVLCAKEYQLHEYECPYGAACRVIRCPLDDSEAPTTDAERLLAKSAAREVVSYWKRGARVLVTCAMGLNRSGLVSALACVRLGASPEEAIRLVRRARGPRALSRPAFLDIVRGCTASRAA